MGKIDIDSLIALRKNRASDSGNTGDHNSATGEGAADGMD